MGSSRQTEKLFLPVSMFIATETKAIHIRVRYPPCIALNVLPDKLKREKRRPAAPAWRGISYMLTTTEAAALLGVSRPRVLTLIHLGTLEAKKHGRDWQVDEASVEAYKTSPRKAGRKSKKVVG